MAEFRKKRKKVCYMCIGKSVDYKDVNVISKYINRYGKVEDAFYTSCRDSWARLSIVVGELD